jgi:DUF1009 family protein
MDQVETLGIIAGNRTLPLVFARQARSLGVKRLVAVAFEGETDPKLASLVDEIVWLKVGQLSKMISAFTSRKVPNASWSARSPRGASLTSGRICAPWDCCSN